MQRSNKMNEQTEEEIVKLRKSGKMPIEIAKKLGIKDVQQVRAICHKNNASSHRETIKVFNVRAVASDKISFHIDKSFLTQAEKIAKGKGQKVEEYLRDSIQRIIEGEK